MFSPESDWQFSHTLTSRAAGLKPATAIYVSAGYAEVAQQFASSPAGLPPTAGSPADLLPCVQLRRRTHSTVGEH